MERSLSHLLENSIQIAWDYLERTGEIDDAPAVSRFLSNHIELLIRAGERRRLLLSNKAIAAFQRFNRARRAA